MSLIRRNNQQTWMPSIFDDFFDNNFMAKANATAPAINVIEEKNDYKVEVAAPGMTKNDFRIHVDEDNNLVITMEKKEETSNQTPAEGEAKKAEEAKKEQRYLRREFYYSKFQQALILPEDVNKKDIAAEVTNGVLTITLPKQTPEQKEQLLQHIEVK